MNLQSGKLNDPSGNDMIKLVGNGKYTIADKVQYVEVDTPEHTVRHITY